MEKFNINNRRYIGNKSKLLEWIFEKIRKNTTGSSFFDVFSGTGSVSKEALKQIEDKKYNVSLKQNGIKEITYIGIAFCGKQIKISYK